jgi:hypothetical protein
MAIAPSGSAATSTQHPLGLLARLLRQRAIGNWVAGMPFMTCMTVS